MSPGQTYSPLWERYKAQIAAHIAACAVIAEDEQAQTDGAVFRLDRRFETTEMERCATDIFHRLIRIAATTFAPSAADELKIDVDEFKKVFIWPLEKTDNWVRFDHKALWDALHERYAGNAGAETAYRQYAAKLVNFFNIRIGQTLRAVGGRVVLDKTVWLDPYDKANGKTLLSLSSREILPSGLAALASFARWAENPETAEGLQAFVANLRELRGAITSRERVEVSADLSIVTYHTRFEFRFSPQLAQKFQIFTTSYATLKDRAA